MRGGGREPIERNQLIAKFRANVAFGGWADSRADELQAFCERLFDAPGLAGLRAFRD